MADNTQQAVSRGARASALLNDDIFNNAVKQVRDGMMETWATCKEVEGRDRIWIAVNLLEQIKSALINTVGNGKVAQAEIDAMAARDKAA
jgi:hypothetical protein